MLDVNNYFDLGKVGALCREIGMPAEITLEVQRCVSENPCDGELFGKLFSIETGGAAVKEIETQFKKGVDSFGALAVYIAAALHTRELHIQKGISNDIYIDTIKVFSRFPREHMESYGLYGFDRDFWMYRCLSAHLFRLGALEFEMCISEDDMKEYAQPSDLVLSVHIPSDAVLTRETLDNSYDTATEFFSRYFPGFNYKCFYCDSWLLSPVLREMLPVSSRILLFGSDYDIIEVNGSDREYIQWIFKRQYDDITSLPESTLLQRRVKQYMQSGGNIGAALGVLKNRRGSRE